MFGSQYFFTREIENLILWVCFALLWMCDACSRMLKFTCQQHIPFLLSHLRCWHGYTTASVDNQENGRTLALLCTRTRAHTHVFPASHPSGLLPSNDSATPKATARGQTRSHSEPQTTDYHPKVADLMKHRPDSSFIHLFSITTSPALSGVPKAYPSYFWVKVGLHPG